MMRASTLAAFLAVAAVGSARASEEARRPFAELLPARTLAYLEVPDAASLRAALARSPFTATWNDAAVAEFLAPLRGRLAKLESNLAERGAPVRAWAEKLDGRVGLALVDLDLTREIPYPDLVLLVDGGAALAGPLEAFVTRDGGSEVAAAEREHGGLRIRALRRGALRVEIAVAGDTLVVGTVAGTLDRVLDAIGGRGDDALAGAEGHRLAMGALPGGVVRGFVHPPAIRASLANFLFPYGAWMRESGIEEVAGIGVSLAETEDGFLETVRIAAPGAHGRGVFRLARAGAWREGLWLGVPKESFAVAVTRVDPGGVWEEAFRIAAAVQPDAAAKLEEGRRAIDGYLGFRLREDVVETFEGTVVAYAAAGRGGGLIPDVVVRFDLAKPGRLAESIAETLKLAKETAPRGSFEHVSHTFGGRTLHWLKYPGKPVMPSWCIDGDRLWFALLPTTLRSALRRVDDAAERGDVPSVLDHSGFARSLERLHASGGTLLWFDLPGAIRYLFNVARPVLVKAIGGNRSWVDAALFPDGEVVAERFGSLALAARGDEGGVTIRSLSPTGVATPLLALFGTGGLFAAGSLSEADASLGATPRERSADDPIRTIDADVRNLDEIGAGLTIYAIDHDGAFPETLAGLFRAKTLSDPTVLLSPGDRAPSKVGGLACSYVYVGAGVTRLETDRRNVVVAWSKRAPRAVLFLDGSVRRVKDDAAFAKLRDATRKRLEETK